MSELLNPSAIRLANGGLNAGAQNSTKNTGQTPQIRRGVSQSSKLSAEDDWRVRISLPVESKLFYNSNDSGVLYPLIKDGQRGVVFPYTPTMTIAHNARYSEQALTHSNYKSYFYEGSDVSPITINGDFSAQSEQEARYVLAAIHFFRACTKMFFGNSDDAGNPPTIVYLDGYGEYYLPHVSCVITQFSHTMPSDVDYIPIQNNSMTRIPTFSQMQVTLQPVYSRRRIHDSFNLNSYAVGGAIGNSKTTGGFL